MKARRNREARQRPAGAPIGDEQRGIAPCAAEQLAERLRVQGELHERV